MARFTGGELISYRMQTCGQEKDKRAFSPDQMSSYTLEQVVGQSSVPLFIKVFSALPANQKNRLLLSLFSSSSDWTSTR